MAWVLIDENNVVQQKQPDPYLPQIPVTDDDGNTIGLRPHDDEPFIEVSDDVICGQIRQEDGTFVDPEPTPMPEVDNG